MTNEPLLLKDWDNWPEAVKKLIDRDGIPIPEYEQGAPVISHDKRRKENRGRPSKYPWDKWMDGKVHHLTAGLDFESRPAVFKNYLYQKTIGTDMRAQINLWKLPDGTEGLDVRFESKTENDYPLAVEGSRTPTEIPSGQEDPVD